MKNFIRRLARDRRGNAAAEYGLILALVGVVSVGMLYSLGNNIKESVKYASCELGTAHADGGPLCTWGGTAP